MNLSCLLFFHFLNNEQLVLMNFLVEGEFASLSKCFCASLVWAFEWLLSSVNIGMFFQILA